MTILIPGNRILPAGQTERVKDGCTEHMHGEYDYWHPVSRIHSGNQISTHRNIDTTRTVWDVDEDGVYDIIEAMKGLQTYYVDLYGDHIALPAVDALHELAEYDTLSGKWCVAVSEMFHLDVSMTIRAGQLSECKISSRIGEVTFHAGHADFEEGTELHDAKLLLETGLAAMYISYPDLADAMHILHISGGGSYYDLFRLLNGGHVPSEILVRDYGVSWETLAKIPLGKPRDCETFTCPLCGERSFFAGVCQECYHHHPYDFCEGCEGCDDDNTPCEGFVEATKKADAHENKLHEIEDAYDKRKEFEHGAILRMIKSGNWSRCRYIRGGD